MSTAVVDPLSLRNPTWTHPALTFTIPSYSCWLATRRPTTSMNAVAPGTLSRDMVRVRSVEVAVAAADPRYAAEVDPAVGMGSFPTPPPTDETLGLVGLTVQAPPTSAVPQPLDAVRPKASVANAVPAGADAVTLWVVAVE